MSIRTDKGELVAECNDCGHEEYGGCQDSFRAFVEELKVNGWRIRKDGDEWIHTCPDCQREG